MSSFNELIKVAKIQSVYIQKQVALADISDKVQAINDLDRGSPNPRTFSRHETRANKAIEVLDSAIRELDAILLKTNPDIEKDDGYIADHKHNRNVQTCLFDVMDECICNLHSKGIQYPPEAKPESGHDDLATIMSNTATIMYNTVQSLIKPQADQNKVQIEAHTKEIKSLVKKQ